MKRHYLWIPIALFLAASVVRILYVIDDKPPLDSDMKDYADCAENFLAGRGLIMDAKYQAYRAPLYPLLLSGQFLIAGGYPANAKGALLLARVIQALLGAGVASIIYLSAIRCFSTGKESRIDTSTIYGAALAGIFVVLFDFLIFYCGEILTEGWYIPALALFSYVLLVFDPGKTNKPKSRAGIKSLGIGCLLGLMALLRPAALFLLPAALIVVGLRTRKFRTVLLTILGTLLTIAPWTIRNAVRLRAFVPISTNTGVNLHIGHNPDFGYDRYGYKEDVRAGRIEQVVKRLQYKGPIPAYPMTEAEESQFFVRLAWHYAKTHPKVTMVNAGRKFINLYRFPDIGKLGNSYLPWPWPKGMVRLTFKRNWANYIPLVSWNFLFMVVVVMGIVLSVRRFDRWYPLYLIILFHTLNYMIFFGTTRFAVPVMPIFCVFAAYGIKSVFDSLAGGRRQKSEKTGPNPRPTGR